MILTYCDLSMTNNRGKEIFSIRQGTSSCLADGRHPLIPLKTSWAFCFPWVLGLPLYYWGSPAQFWRASPLSSPPAGSSAPHSCPASAIGHALLTSAPDSIDTVNAGATGSSRRVQTHWQWTPICKKGRWWRQGFKTLSSSQTTLLAL